jgi:fatty-acyl-CoA synthase
MSDTSFPDIGLGTQILRRAVLSPNKPAITFEGITYSFSELGERVATLAGVLRAGGVNRGDRVGFIGLNSNVFLEALYASSCLGAVFVPLNFRLTGPEIGYIASDAGIHTMIADDMLRPLIDSERESLGCKRYITSESDADGWESLKGLLASGEPVPASESVEASDIAFIMYTSGTTGLPKGAMLTHGNLFWNNINTAFGEDISSAVSLTCAPLFHIGGLNVTTLLTLSKGGHLILHKMFDAAKVLADIETYGVCSMFGAPAMFLMMSQEDSFTTTDFSSVGAFLCGGAPVPVPLIELYGKRGVQFCQGYGLTETAPFASLLGTADATRKVGSAGTAPMFTEVRIVGKDNQPLAANEQGEVCIRGPNVMKGYWNKPAATAEAIDTQGWFHSGDIGYLDNENFLYLCDRVKDMVITGGENVYPAEVESVLYGHGSIKEVAVIGLADEKWGEAVTAICVLNDGHELDLEQLREFGKQSLAKYKLPLQIHFIAELPRNPAGKVLKFKLKEQFA